MRQSRIDSTKRVREFDREGWPNLSKVDYDVLLAGCSSALSSGSLSGYALAGPFYFGRAFDHPPQFGWSMTTVGDQSGGVAEDQVLLLETLEGFSTIPYVADGPFATVMQQFPSPADEYLIDTTNPHQGTKHAGISTSSVTSVLYVGVTPMTLGSHIYPFTSVVPGNQIRFSFWGWFDANFDPDSFTVRFLFVNDVGDIVGDTQHTLIPSIGSYQEYSITTTVPETVGGIVPGGIMCQITTLQAASGTTTIALDDFKITLIGSAIPSGLSSVNLTVSFEGEYLKGYAGAYPVPGLAGPEVVQLKCGETTRVGPEQFTAGVAEWLRDDQGMYLGANVWFQSNLLPDCMDAVGLTGVIVDENFSNWTGKYGRQDLPHTNGSNSGHKYWSDNTVAEQATPGKVSSIIPVWATLGWDGVNGVVSGGDGAVWKMSSVNPDPATESPYHLRVGPFTVTGGFGANTGHLNMAVGVMCQPLTGSPEFGSRWASRLHDGQLVRFDVEVRAMASQANTLRMLVIGYRKDFGGGIITTPTPTGGFDDLDTLFFVPLTGSYQTYMATGYATFKVFDPTMYSYYVEIFGDVPAILSPSISTFDISKIKVTVSLV